MTGISIVMDEIFEYFGLNIHLKYVVSQLLPAKAGNLDYRLQADLSEDPPRLRRVPPIRGDL